MAKYKKKKEGFVARMVMGAEKSEGYARASLPSNRWELFFDLLKGRIGKLILLNLLMCLFFIPLVLLFLFRFTYMANVGISYPYAQGFGVGYQALTSITGLIENERLTANLISFLFLPLAMAVASVGLSGGAYVMRNIVWTEGDFFVNDFWSGIRKNYKQVLIISLMFSFVFYVTILGISAVNKFVAETNSLQILMWILKIFMMVVMGFYSIMTLHMISMSVTYEVKLGGLIKNAYYTTMALVIPNLFFAVVGLIPFSLLLFGEFIRTLSILIIILIGFSFFFLVWTNYCQWIYDKYVNDRVAGARKNRGIYQKVNKNETEEEANARRRKEQLEMAALSSLSSRPIKPITDEELQLAELPASFNRSDIEKLNKSRKELYEDNEKYIREHSSDERYANLEKAQEDLNSAEQERLKRIEQAKKELAKRKKKK